MAKDLTELGLNFNDFEFVQPPQFATPYEFLAYYAPNQNWSHEGHQFTWEDVRNDPALQAILTDVVSRNTRPLILRKKS